MNSPHALHARLIMTRISQMLFSSSTRLRSRGTSGQVIFSGPHVACKGVGVISMSFQGSFYLSTVSFMCSYIQAILSFWVSFATSFGFDFWSATFHLEVAMALEVEQCRAKSWSSKTLECDGRKPWIYRPVLFPDDEAALERWDYLWLTAGLVYKRTKESVDWCEYNEALVLCMGTFPLKMSNIHLVKRVPRQSHVLKNLVAQISSSWRCSQWRCCRWPRSVNKITRSSTLFLLKLFNKRILRFARDRK